MAHMTVKELISELQKCDPDGVVYIDIYDFGMDWLTTYASQVIQKSNSTESSVIINGDMRSWYES